MKIQSSLFGCFFIVSFLSSACSSDSPSPGDEIKGDGSSEEMDEGNEQDEGTMEDPDEDPDEPSMGGGPQDEDDPCKPNPCEGGGTCKADGEEFECECPAERSGKTCEVLDRCVVDNGGCDELTICSDAEGQLECSSCPAGFSGTGETGCVRVGECESHSCENGGVCEKLGAQEVCDCPLGMFGDRCENVVDQLSVSDETMCVVTQTGEAKCWGTRGWNPSGTFRKVVVGTGRWGHIMGLRTDGTLACSGDHCPAGTHVDIVRGSAEASVCAVASGGQLNCWNATSVVSHPEGNFQQSSFSSSHHCGVIAGGEVNCFGESFFGQSNPPDGTDFIKVSVGAEHSCALRSDNTITCWGNDADGQASVPPGHFL